MSDPTEDEPGPAHARRLERETGGRERADLRRRLIQAAYQAEYETGRREATHEQARSAIHLRLARMFVGFTLLFTGLVLLVLPGPGWLCIAAGLGVLSRDVGWAERALQRVRRRLPQDGEGRVSRAVVVTSVFIAMAGVAASIWLMFR